MRISDWSSDVCSSDLQPACLAAPDGNSALHDGLEASAEVLKLITFYSRNLAVPARRAVDDPQVLAGKRVFYESGCIACHRPKYVTRRDSLGAADRKSTRLNSSH